MLISDRLAFSSENSYSDFNSALFGGNMKSNLEDIFISYTHAETTNYTTCICEHFLLLYQTHPFRMYPDETRNKLRPYPGSSGCHSWQEARSPWHPRALLLSSSASLQQPADLISVLAKPVGLSGFQLYSEGLQSPNKGKKDKLSGIEQTLQHTTCIIKLILDLRIKQLERSNNQSRQQVLTHMSKGS